MRTFLFILAAALFTSSCAMTPEEMRAMGEFGQEMQGFGRSMNSVQPMQQGFQQKNCTIRQTGPNSYEEICY